MANADGDDRPIGQLRALITADLLLRPWDTCRPPVTAHLHVLAPLPAFATRPAADRDRPAAAPITGAPTDRDTTTVDGAPITAGQLRELLQQLDAMCPGGLQAPSGGSLSIELTDPVTGALRATVTRAELARRGCPRHAASGEDCGCAVLDRPHRST